MLKKYWNKYKYIIGVCLSAVFLYLSIRKIEFGNFYDIILKADIGTVLIVFALAVIIRILIAYRWFFLLSGLKKRYFADAFNYVNTGYLINNIFPARFGDFAKAVLWAGKTGNSRAKVLASAGFERFYDIFGMAAVFLLSLFLLELPQYVIAGGLILLLFVIILSFALIVFPEFILKIFNNISSLKRYPLYLTFLEKIEKIVLYLKDVSNFKNISANVIITLFIWFLYILTGVIILKDLNITENIWFISVLSLLFVSLSFVLPSSPGNIGVYQYACILAFSMVNSDSNYAFAYSLLSQVPVILLNFVLGFYSLFSEGLSFQKLRRVRNTGN